MDKVIEQLTGKAINRLVSGSYIAREKEDVYLYGAKVAIQSIVTIFAMLTVGALFGKFYENICFMIVFKLLRNFSGGLHSSKFSICFLISVASNVVILIALKFLDSNPNSFFALIPEVISLLIVVILAPIANVNKPISKKERKIFKLIVTLFSVALIAVSVALIVNGNRIVFAISLAMTLNVFLLVIEKIKVRKVLLKDNKTIK